MSSTTIVFPERGDRAQIEEGLQLQPKFDADGLLPCICQDVESGRVLMLAYMNRDALALTIETGEAHYYSRSRQKLWHKGEQSGHTQKVKEVLVDCDQDVVLIKVDTRGAAACHTGYMSCFFRGLADISAASDLALQQVDSEKAFDPAKVYGK